MMHRVVLATLGAAALAVPVAQATATPDVHSAVKKKVTKARYVGAAAPAGRWGDVQVSITVRKTTVGRKVTRKIISVSATAPNHSHRSVAINDQAIPILRQETLAAQSANINLLSEATQTSEAFVQSLQSAIAKER